MKAIGAITKCMVKAFSLGKMVEAMMENILKTRKKDMVLSIGQMAESKKGNGLWANSTERAPIQLIKVNRREENGRKANDFVGCLPTNKLNSINFVCK